MACLIMLSVITPASAGTISLRSEVRAKLAGGRLQVWLSLSNKGDVAAEGLTISAQIGGSKVLWEGPQALRPGRPYQRKLEMPFSPSLPGTYAVIITVKFHDDSGYPFSSIAWGVFSHFTPSVARLSLLSRAGEVYPGPAPAFELVNLASNPLRVRLDVFAPAEMTPHQNSFQLDLVPGRKQVVPVELTNRGGLVGATYPLVGLVSYVQKGVHYTAAAQALLKVGQERDPLNAWRPWLWGLAALLLAAIAAAWLASYWTGRTE